MKNKKTDVLIVGAGPAGLSSAIALKGLGVDKVTVVDRETKAGGMPRLCHHTGFGIRDMHRIYSGPQYARRYVEEAEKSGVKILRKTTVTGWQDTNSLTYTSPNGLGVIDAKAVLLATGCRERPRSARLVPGFRPQGIFTTGSLQRFIYERNLPVGKRAVIVGAELVSLSAFTTLSHAGIEIALMMTEYPHHQIYFPFLAMKWLEVDLLNRTPIQTSVRVNKILGRKRVEGVEIIHTNTGKLETIACDTVVFTGKWIPENEIARLGKLTIDSGTFGPQVDSQFRTSKSGVFAAGNLLRGVETADTSALEGRKVASSIYKFLQGNIPAQNTLPVEVEAPITWVFPNKISVSDKKMPKLSFRVNDFYKNASVQIRQGKKILHTQTFRRLLPNQTIYLKNNAWDKFGLNTEPLKIILSD